MCPAPSDFSSLSALRPADLTELIKRQTLHFQHPLSNQRIDALTCWLEQLVRWNMKIDLTAATSGAQLVDLCVADALVLSKSIDRGQEVVDVGTGAGGPGLALALVRPDLRLTLVEPQKKRVAFLRSVIGLVQGSAGCTAQVIAERAESLVPHRFDCAIARAVLDPAAWLDLGTRLVRRGGRVAVLLTQSQVFRPAPTCEASVTYTWPLQSLTRRLQWYRTAS